MSEAWERAWRERDRGYWRSLAEYADSEAFREAAAGEFPVGADLPPTGVSRRNFMKLAGASLGLAGLSGCISREPAEKILPYTIEPRDATPGVPRYYATSLVIDGFATGLLVKSSDGRPTKVEGNPAHPASLGATSIYDQAIVLSLYDPNRAQDVMLHGLPGTWDAVATELALARPDRGAGLRILMTPQSSPLVGSVMARVLERNPQARFTFHSPLDMSHTREGARMAFGRPLQVQYDLGQAQVVVSLEHDFGSAMLPMSIRYARQWADGRRLRSPDATMNRLYVVEASLSSTGTMADNRLRRRSVDVGLVARALAGEILGGGAGGAANPDDARWARSVADDLRAARGKGVIMVGDTQPPAVHALAHAMNAALGNLGTTTWMTEPTLLGVAGEPGVQDIATLAAEMHAGQVDTLLVLEGNPVYTAPAPLRFAEALGRVRTSIYLGEYVDETAVHCTWYVPAAHPFESWGDARAYDGTLSFVQPLLAPMHGGRTPVELLAPLIGSMQPSAYRMLRDLWSTRWGTAGFDLRWDEALRDGLVDGTAAPRADVPVAADAAPRAAAAVVTVAPDLLELVALQDAKVYDGRFTNNPWLLELPEPVTKVSWDNAALMSVRTAQALGVEDQDVIELGLGGRVFQLAVLRTPGQADGSIAVAMGWGRKGGVELARGAGGNVFAVLPDAGPGGRPGLTVRKTGDTHSLATTQHHWTMDGRPIALMAELADYRDRDHSEAARDFHEALDEQRKVEPDLMGKVGLSAPEQWAMSIDLGVCTGCTACEIACQAENNILVVGQEGVRKRREMYWIRIDTYYTGSVEDPGVVNQPLPCMHCEKAPCEYVCPVNATVHSADGLNEMVYNRCVGTRFCSNNCPYKVRRFNWFNFSDKLPQANLGPWQLQRNPDVTVRQRGVMEKCTYCVQRIRSAEIRSQIEGRRIGTDEIQTACQQACPTRAIHFGSLTHPDSEVVALRAEPRNYKLLNDLNTVPRTQYLAKITNPKAGV